MFGFIPQIKYIPQKFLNLLRKYRIIIGNSKRYVHRNKNETKHNKRTTISNTEHVPIIIAMIKSCMCEMVWNMNHDFFGRLVFSIYLLKPIIHRFKRGCDTLFANKMLLFATQHPNQLYQCESFTSVQCKTKNHLSCDRQY